MSEEEPQTNVGAKYLMVAFLGVWLCAMLYTGLVWMPNCLATDSKITESFNNMNQNLYDQREIIYIESIRDTDWHTYGQFIFGSGYVNSEPVYYFRKIVGNATYGDYITQNGVPVYKDVTDGNPYILKYDKYFQFMPPEIFTVYEVHLPENSTVAAVDGV